MSEQVYLVESFSRPDDLVVDYECGSGSSVVAAVTTGRRYAGSDIDREAVEVARRRIDEAIRDPGAVRVVDVTRLT